jgi:predicted O-linked N-acetylglucosamine transferase (SPINDLY family)
MPQMTLQAAFELAVRHHEAGQLNEADSLYRQILEHQPGHADSLHLRGVLAGQLGHFQDGIDLIRRAIVLQPESAQYYSNLGVILGNLGRHEESIAAHRQALSLYPTFTEARGNLAAALLESGRVQESMAEYQRLVAEQPEYPEGLNGLGNALLSGKNLDGAIAMYQRALMLKPAYPDAASNLCNALRLRGRYAEAVAAGQQAVALRPDFAEAFNNLGTAFQMNVQHDEAIAAYRRAVELRPGYVQAFYNLGGALQSTNRLDEAIKAYHKALALQPDYPEVHGNLGNALKDMGRIDEALDSYRKAVTLKSECKAADNLLFGIHFHEGFGSKEIFEEHARWNRRYARPLASFIKPFHNDRSPNRPLRIGYVSPDLSVHPVGRFLLPLLAQRDRANFNVTCYSDVSHPDWMTEKIQAASDLWRVTVGLNDEQIADQIYADQIDILVDLTMHAEGSRLLVFARKPAPVQVTYLAYCSTTGLETMDYRLTDPYLDPVDSPEADACYSERSVRLPYTYWCYQAPVEAPQVGPMPAGRSGQVTFGCLNNYSKISPSVLSTWCEILKRVPNSKLLVFSREGAHRQRALDLVALEGIDLARFQFVGPVPTEQYFRRYLEIDIALDPFPYPGGTTTCDALWMGVPVISLAGRTAVSRGGLSILSNVGLADLVARDREQYVASAANLAADVARIANLRATLRGRMLASPLMDAQRFTRDVEGTFRDMWRSWCGLPIAK